MKHRLQLGIEISHNEIRAALVEGGSASARVLSLVSAPIPNDSFDGDSLRRPQEIGRLMKETVGKLAHRANAISIGLTGSSMVARILEIPRVPDSEVRSVLLGELDHYRILPGSIGAFDYFRLSTAIDEEQSTDRVLLFGVDDRTLESYNEAIIESSLKIQTIEPNSLAQFRLLAPNTNEADILSTIIIGAYNTDVLITERGNLRFFRRLSGGSEELTRLNSNAGPTRDLTASFDETSELEPLGLNAPVEEKVSVEVPAAPTSYSFDPNAVSQIMAEVQRVLDYYRREYLAPDALIPTQMLYYGENASELLELAKQYFRGEAILAAPGAHIAVADNATDVSDITPFSVAIGLALRNLGTPYSDAPKLNLVSPETLGAQHHQIARLVFSSFASAAGILVLVVGYVLLTMQLSGVSATLKRETDHLNAETRSYAQYAQQIQQQQQLVSAIQQQGLPILQLVEYLSAATSSKNAFTDLMIDHTGLITLAGRTLSARDAADLMDTIGQAPLLKPIQLNDLQRDSNAGSRTLHFDMTTGVQTATATGTGGQQ